MILSGWFGMRGKRRREKRNYYCMNCRVKISKEEYEAYHGYCRECFEAEIAELDLEEE